MNIRHCLSVMFVALALTAFAMPASACHGHKSRCMMHMGMYKHCGGKPRCYPGLVRGECQMIPGHWWQTTWVPEHKACWYLKG